MNAIDLGNNTGITFNPLPNIVTLNPSSGSEISNIGQNLSITFDETVSQGTGNITLYTFDDIVYNQIDVTGGGVTRNVGAKLVDLLGNVLWSTDIKTGYDGYEEVDVSEFESGMYILYVYDKENSKENVASYRIIIQD